MLSFPLYRIRAVLTRYNFAAFVCGRNRTKRKPTASPGGGKCYWFHGYAFVFMLYDVCLSTDDMQGLLLDSAVDPVRQPDPPGVGPQTLLGLAINNTEAPSSLFCAWNSFSTAQSRNRRLWGGQGNSWGICKGGSTY